MKAKSSKKIKFGIVGCGGVAYGMHLPDLIRKENRDRAELVATCDTIEKRARITKELWHAKGYYTDFDTMLDKTEVDAVIITTGISSHGPLAIKAAKAGKHFFTQKPMATNMKDADAVVRETRKAKVKGQVRPDTPLVPLYKKARSIVKEGHVGRPLWFRAGFGRHGPSRAFETFYTKKAGGPLFDIGVYSISPITFILGPVKRVVGLAAISIPKRTLLTNDVFDQVMEQSFREKICQDERPRLLWKGVKLKYETIDAEAEDNTFTLLDLGSGCLGCVISNFVTLRGLKHTMPFGLPTIEIYGEKGGLIVGGVKGSDLSVLTISKDSKYWIPPSGQDPGAWFQLGTISRKERTNEMVHFIDCIVNDQEPLPNVEWGRHVAEIMIKSIESSRTGKALNLNTTFSMH